MPRINQIKSSTVIFLLFFTELMICQPVNKKNVDPVIKSFFVPGWGQNDFAIDLIDLLDLNDFLDMGMKF